MRRILRATMLIAVSGLSACGGDAPVEPGWADLSGVYLLVSVNGDTLPLLISQNGAETVELFAEQLIVVNPPEVTRTTSIKSTSGNQNVFENTSEVGTYRQNGANVTFTFTMEPKSWSGTVESDGAITVVFAEGTLLFRRLSGVQ